MTEVIPRVARYLGVLTGAVVVSLLGVGMVFNVLQASARTHSLLGLGMAGVVLVLMLLALRGIHGAPLSPLGFGMYPRTGLILNLALIVLISIVAAATVSDGLYRAGLVRYTAQQPISLGLFLDYYGWHFVDSLPVLGIWKTFDVEVPAKGVGPGAGLLSMSFRVAIIAWAISLLGSKRTDVRYLAKLARMLRENPTLAPRLTSRRRDVLEAALTAPARLDTSLYRVDAHLEYARYWTEKAEIGKARAYVELALKRLDPEIEARDVNARLQEIRVLSARFEERTSPG